MYLEVTKGRFSSVRLEMSKGGTGSITKERLEMTKGEARDEGERAASLRKGWR